MFRDCHHPWTRNPVLHQSFRDMVGLTCWGCHLTLLTMWSMSTIMLPHIWGGVLIFRGTPKASLDKLGLSKNGGTPIPGWILVENPMKMDDLGVPHGTPPFQETSIWVSKLMVVGITHFRTPPFTLKDQLPGFWSVLSPYKCMVGQSTPICLTHSPMIGPMLEPCPGLIFAG